MTQKPHFNLVLEKGTSSVSFFSDSNPSTNKDASIIWTRQKSIKQLCEQDIKEELLKNPKSVYFAPALVTVLRFKSIPCKIVPTSSSIFKVILKAFFSYLPFAYVKYHSLSSPFCKNIVVLKGYNIVVEICGFFYNLSQNWRNKTCVHYLSKKAVIR